MTTLSPTECQHALQVAFKHFVLGETTYDIMQAADEGRTTTELAERFGMTRQGIEYRIRTGKSRLGEFMRIRENVTACDNAG